MRSDMGRGESGSTSATSLHHTAKATARIRNKITHKTRLRVIHGDGEADRIFSEHEVHDGKALATGVDAEDANEFHLLAALKASQQQHSAASTSTFCQPSTSNTKKSALVSPPPPPPVPYIPTPDATGKVENYADFYPEIRSKQSSLLAKASETLEDAQRDCLTGGYAYVMDERDAEWLERNNKLASGEGPSSSSFSAPRGSRSAKAKGKEPEIPATVAISEDDFELVMGLFEKLTDEKSPYLHLSPSEFPPFADYDAFFSSSIPPHLFPSYTTPPSVPDPPTLYKYARIIYPYWRERKADRGGRHIIPQLNYDESNESDPYVCFRRRMPKPLRKTRRQDPTQLDRLSRLSEELRKILELAQMTIRREQLKLADIAEARAVCEARLRVIDIKRKAVAAGAAGAWLANVNDDELFVERERMVVVGTSGLRKKSINEQQVQLMSTGQTGQTIKLRRNNREDLPLSAAGGGGAVGANVGGVLPTELHQYNLRKLAELQNQVDREVARRKDGQWEDVTENPYLPMPTPLTLRHFRSSSTLLFQDESPVSPSTSSPSRSSSPPSSRPTSSRSGDTAFRLRRGRGGRTMLDRHASRSHGFPVCLAASKPVPPPLQPMPDAPDKSTKSKFTFDVEMPSQCLRWKQEQEGVLDDDEKERLWRLQERWKYDVEGGLVVGGAGLAERIGEAEDPRFIVDDYESSIFNFRKLLLQEEDFSVLLRTDDSILRHAEKFFDTRREAERQFAQEAREKAILMRREMATRQPLPAVPPPTPAAIQQVKKPSEKIPPNGPQQAVRATSRAPHPLATSTTPSQGAAAEPDEEAVEPPPVAVVAQSTGTGLLQNGATMSGPVASNSSPLVSGVTSSGGVNGVGFLAPPTQPHQSVTARPSSSPLIPDYATPMALSTAPAPAPRAPSPVKPPSSSQVLPQTTGGMPNPNPSILGNAVNGLTMPPNGVSNLNFPNGLNMNGYGMMPIMPNGYPMLMANGGHNATNLNGAAAFANNPNVMVQIQQIQQMQQLQRMANGAGAGQLLMNGNGASHSVNGLVNGLPPQQQQLPMMALKNPNLNGTVFAQQQHAMNAMPTPQSMMNGSANVNGLGQQPSQQAAFHQMNLNMMGMNGMPMNLNLNGTPQSIQNMNLALGNGNIKLKLPERAIQLAAANGHANGVGKAITDANGLLPLSNTSPQRQQNSSSPAPASAHGRASPANAARLNGGATMVNRNSPHMQAATLAGRASPSGMRPGASPSPRIPSASQVGHVPSPLATAQQAVGHVGVGQPRLNGF